MNGKMGRLLQRIISSRFIDLFPNPNRIRFAVYKSIFNLEHFSRFHHNVDIKEHHKAPLGFKKINSIGLKIGENCLFEDNVVIDITGNVIIGNNVVFIVDSIIYSHTHTICYEGKQRISSVNINSLVIDDDVSIGARSIIVGCNHIGRFANIGAGSVVRNNVPPYAIVVGNPAKIVGFKMTPKQIIDFEKQHYDEKDRIPYEQLYENYEKFFVSRRKEIVKFVKL